MFRASPLCPAGRYRPGYAPLRRRRFPDLGEGLEKKALVISLDEVVAGRYDEGMHKKMLGIVSETIAFFS